MNTSNSLPVYDLLVIGGGINGAGVAADAQGRGLKTALIEMNDLASATSSVSSKLIHGGLRYLEHYEFRLVKEALNEREVVFKKAPHIVKPMRFVLPHRPHLRPSWMIRAGLFLYDALGKRDLLPGSEFLRFNGQSPLKPEIKKGYEYSDCWVDDARLVVLNAVQCRESGGDVFVQTKCIGIEKYEDRWQVKVLNQLTGETRIMRSKALVNAAGPWVKNLLNDQAGRHSPRNIRLIKGSHIVVPKIHDKDHAFILQNEDGRIVFVIPYLDQFSIVGTTDVEHDDAPEKAAISNQETCYLCDVVNDHFNTQIKPADVIWSFSGVRPLCDDESSSAQAITRDYTIELEESQGLPLLSIFGGKLTTYRKLGEAVLNRLQAYFPQMGPAWTEDKPLPGGDLTIDINAFTYQLQSRYRFLSQPEAKRLATTYGSRAEQILEGASSFQDLGIHFGQGFTQRELNYLLNEEFVTSTEDVIWRRTKLGLFLDKQQRRRITDYIQEQQTARQVAA